MIARARPRQSSTRLVSPRRPASWPRNRRTFHVMVGHVSAKAHVLGLVDLAHAPATQFAQDLILMDGLADHGVPGYTIRAALYRL